MTTEPVRAPSLITLILLSALAILPIAIFLPSIAAIARSFDVDYGVINLALSGYAAASACLQLVLGPLSDRYGRRPVVLVGLIVFILASIGAATATSAVTFLAFRMLQAVIASGYVVAMAVIRDTTRKEETASRIGYVAMAWSLAPMMGPSLGGLLDQNFGWRSVFWLLAVLGVAVFALCWVDLRETNTNRRGSGVGHFSAYPTLLRCPPYWAYTLCQAFSAGAFYAFLAGAPMAAEAAFGMSPAMVGLGLGSITGGFMLGSFLAGRFAKRFALMTTIIAGRLVSATGLVLGLLLYLAGAEHPISLFGPCMFVGIGNGLTIPSANAAAISVRPGMSGSAAGLAAAITVATGAIVATITGAMLTPDNARYALLAVMLISNVIALAAALSAGRLEGR